MIHLSRRNNECPFGRNILHFMILKPRCDDRNIIIALSDSLCATEACLCSFPAYKTCTPQVGKKIRLWLRMLRGHPPTYLRCFAAVCCHSVMKLRSRSMLSQAPARTQRKWTWGDTFESVQQWGELSLPVCTKIRMKVLWCFLSAF